MSVWDAFGDAGIKTFMPGCVFLDYLLLKEKTVHAPHQITVLPEIYKPQQAQLKTVLARLVIPDLVLYEGKFFGKGGLEKEIIYEK